MLAAMFSGIVTIIAATFLVINVEGIFGTIGLLFLLPIGFVMWLISVRSLRQPIRETQNFSRERRGPPAVVRSSDTVQPY